MSQLLGARQKERFEQMEKSVNQCEIDWWFYRSSTQVHGESELRLMLDFLSEDTLKIGPFTATSVMDRPNRPKTEFFNIPLRDTLGDAPMMQEDVIAFLATSHAASVLMHSSVLACRLGIPSKSFFDLRFGVVMVERSQTPSGQVIVSRAEMVENLRPLAHYEYPSNYRLMSAIQGEVISPSSALLMVGDRVTVKHEPMKLLPDLTQMYNEYDRGNLEKVELHSEIYKRHTGNH